jgi:hypothetical protein
MLVFVYILLFLNYVAEFLYLDVLNMSFYNQFRALPFKSFSNNPLRKLNRKNSSETDYFPAEGHVNVCINSTSYLFWGGARRGQEASWSAADTLYKCTYYVDDDDVNVDNISTVKLSGAKFTPLQSSAGFYVPTCSTLYVWGGLNLCLYNMSQELLIVKLHEKKGVVEIVQPPGGISLRELKGEIPLGRCGHSLTHFDESLVILHGGLCFPHRNSCSSLSLFTNVTNDDCFYSFDYDELLWTKLSVHGPVPRAYHTASTMVINGMRSIVYVGGVTKTESTLHRVSLSEVLILRMDSERNFLTETVTFGNSPAVGVSYHSAAVIGPYMFVVGGVDENNLEGRHSITVFNFQSLSCEIVSLDPSFRSAGHSALVLSDDCLMICGGKQLQYFVYTSKPMVPSCCELNENCQIMASSETSPIAWVQCEGSCKRWLHQYCVGVLDSNLSRKKFVCDLCKQSSKGKKRKTIV